MVRKKRRRPNWPYRFTWLAIVLATLSYIAIKTLIGGMTFANRSYGTDWPLALVAACLDATFGVWYVAVGACIGSFLNVVAYRLPLGRHIGGHSGCPYCETPIESTDNVPVLAWIGLRGRCRTCRLPISIQYPIVELTVAIVFFVVFVTEFSSYGRNLPGTPRFTHHITAGLILQSVTYLFLLSGLLAAALIAVKRQIVPLKLYFWSILPLTSISLLATNIIPIRWRDVEPYGPLEDRLDVLATLVCGAVAGIAVARLIAPLIYKGLDSSLAMSDQKSASARQFICGMAIAGASVGWQSVVPLTWLVLLSAIVGSLLFRSKRQAVNLSDLTCWIWLGLLVFRGYWSGWYSLQLLPSNWPEVIRHVVGALFLAPLAIIFASIAGNDSSDGPAPDASQHAELLDEEDDISEEIEEQDPSPEES